MRQDTQYKNNMKNTRWPKKVSHCQIIQKLCKIELQSANEMRFLCQIKEMIKHYNIIRRY